MRRSPFRRECPLSSAARFPPKPVLGSVEDREWVDHAICRGDHHLFFEPFGERPGPRRRREAVAKQLCACCPVQLACMEAGRRNHESGIWGGETEDERVRAGFPPRANVRRSLIAARREARSADAAPDDGQVA